jgi:hypothetical protein
MGNKDNKSRRGREEGGGKDEFMGFSSSRKGLKRRKKMENITRIIE